MAERVDLWRADRIDTRLRQGRLDERLLGALARAVAERVASLPLAEGCEGTPAPETLVGHARALAARLEAAGATGLGPCGPDGLLGFQERCVQAESERLKARIEAGRVRRDRSAFALERAYVDAQLRVALPGDEPDALEVASDPVAALAKLAVALRAAGRADLAERFVASYAQAANDFDLYRVLAIHESLAATALAADAAESNGASAAGRLLALALPVPPKVQPRVIAVGGLVASGKSTVAARVAAELGAPVVSSDRTREAMVAGDSGDWARGLEPGFPYAIYLAMAESAEAVLGSGRSVVLDGCFRARAMRRAARRLARERGLPFLFLECRASERAVQRRLAGRAEQVAWSRLYDQLRAEWEPVQERAEGEHSVIDTSRGDPRGVARAVRSRSSASLVA